MARASRKTRETVRQLALDFNEEKTDDRTATDPYEPFWKREIRRLNSQVVKLYQENTQLRTELRDYRAAN